MKKLMTFFSAALMSLSMFAAPITVEKAIEIGTPLSKGAPTTDEYTVEGYVVQLVSTINASSKQSFYMADAKDAKGPFTFEAYSCTVTKGIVLGAKVTVTGKILKYNDAIIEIKEGTVSITEDVKAEELTFAEVKAAIEALDDPTKGNTYGKYVSFIAYLAANVTSGKVEVMLAANSGEEGVIKAYQLAVAKDLPKDQKVQVVGTITKYKKSESDPVALEIVQGTIEEALAPKHTITVAITTDQESMGEVNINGSGTTGSFEEGASVTLNAKAKVGYIFDKWSDGGAASHAITVGTEDATFTASFKADPNMKTYPIKIAGQQVTSSSLIFTKDDLTGIMTAGTITYDDANKTLTLAGVNINMTADGTAIEFDNGSTAGADMKVVVIGDCKIAAKGTAMSFTNFKSVTVSNFDASSKLALSGAHGIALKTAPLTIEGLVTKIDGSTDGIAGNDVEVLTIKGANVSVKGIADGSIIKIKNLKTEYCAIDANHEFVAANKQVEKTGTGTVAKDEVKFEPFPMIIVKPLEEGTGHFELSSGNVKFTDKGWFQAGAEIKIVAKAATGFEFSHWTDDTGWKDPATKVKATGHDNITMPATDKTYDNYAVFYYKPKSTTTWFGVNDGNFISFKMSDYGKAIKKASGPDASSVKAGDFGRSNSWYILNGSTLQMLQSFSAVQDGKDLKDPKDVGAVTEAITDMAFDLLGNKLYGVAGTKLYLLKEESGAVTVEEQGEFQLDGAAKKVEAIAIDAKKTMYLLSSEGGGTLYTAQISKIKDKKVPLAIVGEESNAGKIGVSVKAGKEQSIAFDHATGELFWGADDYIRYINPKTAKANIAGDLEQQEGSQGYIKALHNLSKAIWAYVKVADGQDDWGTANIDGDKEKKVITGTKFTITANAEKGYHFTHWEIAGESDVTEPNYETSIKSETTFIAHFEAGDGIQNITIDPTLKVQKVLIDGEIYIVRDGKVYTTTGQLMK